MQREIIFRGFHPCDGPDTIVVDGEKVKGRWVEGDFLPDCNGDTYITACKFIPMMPGFEKRTTLPIRCDHPEKWVLSVDTPVFEVLSSTVGQWIEKIDKHKKKVFSGDKVYYSHENRIYSVEWNDSLLRWEGSVGWIAVPLYQFVDSCEVIGTVFDEHEEN